ncbi:hypothetical protein BH20ACI3_BH20ACI3_42340 [soil metagenome]
MPVVKLFESLGLPIVFGQVFEHLIGLRAQVDRFTRSQQRSPPTGTNPHIDITGTITTVPEPATVVLLGSGSQESGRRFANGANHIATKPDREVTLER